MLLIVVIVILSASCANTWSNTIVNIHKSLSIAYHSVFRGSIFVVIIIIITSLAC